MAKVLVVEDDPSVSRLVKTVLHAEGHTVTLSSDGATGLKAFAEAEPDVVVLDWMMPGMSGLEMLEKLKVSGGRAKTRIIMLTGKVQETDMLRAWQAGVDAYLTKPFEPDALTTTVRDVLRADQATLDKRRLKEIERAKLLRALDEIVDDR